jgi:hypothetical protein
MTMQTSAEDKSNRGPDAGSVITDPEAQPAVQPKRITELMQEAAKDVGAGRCIGL